MASIFNFPGSDIFGFRGECVNNPSFGRDKSWEWNTLNSVGYSPGLSFITGCFRIYAASKNLYDRGWKENEHAASAVAVIVRGVVEILQLGILLFVIDVIFTVGRLLTGTTTNKSTSNRWDIVDPDPCSPDDF